MPPKKYLDFVESTPFVRIAKQHAKGEHDVRRYVTITCPYCAIEFVEITVDSLPTNKASECKKHLLRCESASAVGVCTEPVKRKRVVTGVESMDEGLCVERATNAALVASEARLIASNEDLRGRVASLETQMSEKDERLEVLDRQMQAMSVQLSQLNPLVPLVQRIARELGLPTDVPPAAPTDAYVSKLEGLKRAAAITAGKKVRELQRELATARKAVGDLNTESRAARDLRNCFNEYPRHPNEARSFLRTVAKAAHPDKHGGSESVTGKLATGLQSALNAVRQSLPE